MARWLLPEGIADVLPDEARQVEELRRIVLDLLRGYGYQLVAPPLIEYLDSLLTGTGRDLDLRTFKLVDQLSGRQLGLRADITPQTARIDAHVLGRRGVARLCYAGSVLHARPAHPLASREPLQIGAELYGHAGAAADAEIQALAAEALRRVGVADARFDFGHTGVVRGLLAATPIATEQADEILAALGAKDLPALRALVAGVAPATARALLELPTFYGDRDVIAAARRVLPALPAVTRALDELEQLVRRAPAASVGIDLSDLHGYRYYTGVNFAAYAPDASAALLRGGRYDDIGRAFGRARPATGFSIDLRELSQRNGAQPVRAIIAPADDDDALEELLAQLRADGEIVIRTLGDDGEVEGFACDRQITRTGSRWRVRPREPNSQ